MYKAITTIGELYGYVFLDNKIYTHRKKISKIQELSLLGDVLWESNEKDIWNYYVHKDFILFNLYDNDEVFDNTYIYNRLTKELISNNKLQLYCILNKECYKDNILYDVKNDEVILFNLSEGKIIKEVVAKTSGRVSFISDNCIVKNDNSYIYVYSKTDFSLLWQVDLSEKIKRIDTFKGTEVEGIIKGVLVYKDNLIVYSDGGVASLKLEDGSLNWFTKTYAVTFCIVGNIGYGGSNAAIYKINLNTGEMSGFDWKDHGMPDIEYQGKIYIPFCGDIIHHEGLLWRSWYDAGHSFLVAINPYDGHYEWVHHVDTNEKIGPPEFHDNKIFLLDTGGTLHIYEKEENNV